MTDTRNFPRSPAMLSRQRGLSLAELMISLAIGLMLLLGITSLIVQQNDTRAELDKSSRQVENGRYAMQLLHDDIEHAGFYGAYYLLPAPTALPDPCATTVASLDAAMPVPIQGYDVAPSATSGSPIACLPNANYKPGTDIVVVRRAASTSQTVASVAGGAAGQVYLQTTPFGHVLNTGANSGSFTLAYNTTTNTSVALLRPYLVHIYFISPCSIMANGSTCTANDDNGRPIPTLKMLELGANGAATTFTLTPLVEGIENMQLDYGLDADGDGYPDNNFTTVPISATDWSNVMALRINLLARSTECSTGYTDTKTYSLGQAGTVSPPAPTCNNGDFKRHVFSALVRATNPSGRRAQE